MKGCIFLSVAVLVSSCATKHDKLDAYVGKDIQQAVADLGLPTLAFDVVQERRDFQWVVTSSKLPSYAISASAITDPQQQFDPRINTRVITPMFDGKPIMSECLYTLMTRWNEELKRWIVSSYHIPTSGC